MPEDILTLVLYPDKRLRVDCELITSVDDKIRELFDKMEKAMLHYDGIGIAGPQLGIMKKMFVVNYDHIIKSERFKAYADNYKPLGKQLFMANAQIIESAIEKNTEQEGCLSLPGIFADVERPNKITVKYIDYDGAEQIMIAEGLLSSCIQHEMDHVNGKLFIDYVTPLKRGILLKKLQKILNSRNSTE